MPVKNIDFGSHGCTYASRMECNSENIVAEAQVMVAFMILSIFYSQAALVMFASI
jgi:hypothetical protein